MIRHYTRKDFLNLLDFLKENNDSEFYLTKDNSREPITNEVILKQMIKECVSINILEELGLIVGIIAIWKSTGNSVNRHYVKVTAKDIHIVKKLLTQVLWNENRELYAKMKKTSSFLEVFKEKGFEFRGDRGRETLLYINNINRIKSNGHYQDENKGVDK